MNGLTKNVFLGVLVLASSSCLAHDDETAAKATLDKMSVVNNTIYNQDVLELRKLYSNHGGQACITYSQALQHKSKVDPRDENSCKTYQKHTPYTLAEIVDPKAISIFKQETLKASCVEQEKRVDGRFVKRTPACAEYFAQIN